MLFAWSLKAWKEDWRNWKSEEESRPELLRLDRKLLEF